jgi:thiamine-phosphate pyrophosphorylase
VKVHAIVTDLETARRAVDAGATVVQLRVKAPTEVVVERGRGFNELGVTFVVNDDVEAALELKADGVHLGQGDAGAERARDTGLLLGRSVVTVEQALTADADYLGAGPVWETPSKADADPAIGLDGLGAICAAVPGPRGRDRRHRRRQRRRLCSRRRSRRCRHPRGDRPGAAEGR